VYCGKPADTREHVPPRLIYLKPYPANLATVACCNSCNGGWSKDEEYFKLALSLMGGSAVLDEMHEAGGWTDRTLSHEEALGLDDTIVKSIGVDEAGLPFFEPDTPRLRRVLEKITKGLCAINGWRTTQLSFSAVCLDRLPNLLTGPTTADEVVSVFGDHDVNWNDVQSSVFEYTFFRTHGAAQGQAFCAMRFYTAIGAVIELQNMRDVDWKCARVLPPVDATEVF
jgi:hypothetical protein